MNTNNGQTKEQVAAHAVEIKHLTKNVETIDNKVEHVKKKINRIELSVYAIMILLIITGVVDPELVRTVVNMIAWWA